jgi:hypothetical protein
MEGDKLSRIPFAWPPLESVGAIADISPASDMSSISNAQLTGIPYHAGIVQCRLIAIVPNMNVRSNLEQNFHHV